MKEAWRGSALAIGLVVVAAVAVGKASSWTQPAPGPQWKKSRVQPHAGLAVVNPPHLSPFAQFSRRDGPLPGYLHLKPVSNQRRSRWFDETTQKPQHSQPRVGYEKYPPFWSDNQHKTHNKNKHRQAKKECNLCNSVPWTPIFKSPAGLSSNRQPHELVPHVEVYPEASIQQNSILSPNNAIIQPAISTVLEPSAAVSLPVGNVPVLPSLLLPPIKQVPFPELSPHHVAPVHDSARFHEPIDLVPPQPPKVPADVVLTISEPEGQKNVHSASVHDQHSDSSSLVDSRVPQNLYQQPNFPSHQNQLQNYHYYQPHSSGLDIVKSVPLAEYTSSIEHPAHVIQAPQYIDVQSRPAAPNTVEYTYEKASQTGEQKVSDLILGATKNTNKLKIVDSSPAGTDDVEEHAISPVESLPIPARSSYENQADGKGQILDPNILTPPALPPHLTQLLPTYDTSFLHPLFPVESKGVASQVNGALLPPLGPQAMNPTLQPTDSNMPPKKIQIIIPYTTMNDQNAMGTSLRQINKTIVLPEKAHTWPPIVVTETFHNQPRRVPYSAASNKSWTVDVPSENSQIQHILASNIRDLLKKEMEPKQNIRLQKNIDNWTALEFSNHKTIGKKVASEVISHAQAVTSIPGTSISHLLFPSKKIPDGYFPTSVAPNFDEPATTPFPTTSVSVNSEPFTTASRYSSVAWSGPSSPRSLNQQITSANLPEYDYGRTEIVTAGPSWSDAKVSVAPGTNEKVYVVTPVSSVSATRRSTRHVDTTEKYTPETSVNSLFTKLEKVTNLNPSESPSEKSKKPLYPKSTGLFRIKADPSRYQKISKFTKPKPIEKFFSNTTAPINVPNVTTVATTPSTWTTIKSLTTPPPMFPFRNGGEIPLEMSNVNFSASQLAFKNTGSRKTLIKQVKTNRRPAGDASANTAYRNEGKPELSPSMQVDVVLPVKPTNKKGEGKKPTSYWKKKSTIDSIDKANKTESTAIKTDEPNITEDDRENINDLMKELALRAEKENETLLAVETTAPLPVEPVPINSSRSLLDTIKLLREFLAETSDEDLSQEKNDQLDKVIEKLNTTEPATAAALNNPKYKDNFPEYLTEELQLNKDEMSLVKSAMVELKKSRVRKKEA